MQPKILRRSIFRLITYEQIPIIRDRSHNGSGVYRFLSATGNQRDEYHGIVDGPSFTDSSVGGTAQEHWRSKTESVKDRGLRI
jgi:hypothetical protein